MNKNGFTLVELIAVIVILGLLALIANSSVINVVKNSKSDLYNTQLKLIESAAESWGNDNLDKLPNDGECKYLTLANLKNYGLMEEEIINPKTNKEFSDDLTIKIISKINSSGVLKTTYKVDDSINGCTEALPRDCILVSGEAYTIGAKYSCDFGGGARNFYILELGTNPVSNTTLKSNEVALILEGNYDSTTYAWCNPSGPNPANNICNADGLTGKLDEISGVWTKLERSQIGLPSVVQVVVADGLNENSYIETPTLTNAWLYNWPDNPQYGLGENPPFAYWTSSPSAEDSNTAWRVYYSGAVHKNDIYVDSKINFGVRPVITLHDYQIR